METKVLLATSIKDIDKYIQKQRGIEVIGPVYYREAVLETEEDFDVVVLSSVIDGTIDLMELAYNLRSRDKRVIYIEWQTTINKEFLCGLIQIGIYDIMVSPVSLPEMLEKIKHPSTFSQAAVVVGKTKEELFEEINHDDGKFKSLIKDIAARCNPRAPTDMRNNQEIVEEAFFLPEKEPVEESPLKEEATTFQEDESHYKKTLVYSLGFSDPQMSELGTVVGCSDWEEIKAKIQEKKPGVIFISAQVPGIVKEVGWLRRKISLADVPIIIMGTPKNTEECFAAGADECIKELNNEDIARIKAIFQRLKGMWKMAVKDELTGLYTRKFLQEYLPEQILRHKQKGHIFSIAMIDIDKFKSVNDTYGHDAGDVVLKELAVFLTQNLRETSVAFRYGGEEFLVVLPGCKQPFKVIDSLRSRWEERSITLPSREIINTTFSAGVKIFTGETSDELIKEADVALYQAKANGRNRVEEAGALLENQPKQQEKEKWVYSNSPEASIISPIVPTPDLIIGPKPNTRIAAKKSKTKPFIQRMLPQNKPSVGRGSKVIAVGAPWVSSGCSTIVAILAGELARTGSTSAVDCDLTDRGMGVRFDLPLHMIEINDWRKTDIPAHKNGITIFPLDPSRQEVPTRDRMSYVINEAQRNCEFMVLDVGNNPEGQWFKYTVGLAGLLVWVINSDPLVLERARSKWRERPAVTCREIMVLFGDGDPGEIEQSFIVPCVQVKSSRDKRGIKKLGGLVKAIPAEQGIRVLAVGFKKAPKLPGVVYEIFDNPAEAMLWLENNTPHGAIIAENSKDNALLEYDLLKKRIPVQRCTKTNPEEVVGWLRSL